MHLTSRDFQGLEDDLGAAGCVGVVQVDSCHVVSLLNVLVHAAPVREDSITELAGKLLPVMKRLPVRLEVALAAESFPALGTRMDLCHTRVLLLPVSEEGPLTLEDLATVKAREVTHGAVVLAVMLRDVGHRDELGDITEFSTTWKYTEVEDLTKTG